MASWSTAPCGCEFCRCDSALLVEPNDLCRGCGDDVKIGDYCGECFWGQP